jgi:nanoRNase/pAp phosphatase (c-di-AMP/oligoRNAs hydrolase)
MNPADVDFVIYHGQCPDGAASAWATHGVVRSSCVYVAALHNEAPPDVTGRNVAILDFSYDRDVLEEMASKAANLIVIDHHVEAEKKLSGLPYVMFDMTRSGAKMSWDFFHPSEQAPWVISYVEDRDLWRWALPGSRDVGAWMQRFAPFTPESINEIAKIPLETALREGGLIRQTLDAYIAATRQFSTTVQFSGHKTAVCNATRWGVSELANAMLDDGHPLSLVWFFDHEANIVRVSLRSKRPDLDVGAIATSHGGGGHLNAAGFEVKTPADLWSLFG